MDRRTFVVHAIAAMPLSRAMTRTPITAWDRTDVTVNHEGDKPVEFTVTGTVVRDNRPSTYTSDQPLKLTTPATFAVDVVAGAAVITVVGTEFLRVTADHPTSAQHLMGRAPMITIRHRTTTSSTVMI